jgi:TIR domain
MASVFISYSHKDEALRDQLEAHLALLRHEGLIDAWHDRSIIAGNEVDNEIFAKLNTADIILLLVSSDFLNSQYCYSKEMTRAMQRHEAGEVRVMPVILRYCEWQNAPFGKLLAAPKDGKPIMSWPDRDEAFTDVAKTIRTAVTASKASKAIIPEPQQGGMRSISAVAVQPSANSIFSATSFPRSSNLRLKKEFSEQDRDDFLRATFDFVYRFFDASIAEISKRNPAVSGRSKRIDSRRMSAVLYRNGNSIADCSIRLDGFGRSNCIAFSYGISAASNSFNEMLTVEVTDQDMYFKSMGMQWNGNASDKHLSQEGAAEFLWDLFIRKAQH